MSNQEIQKVKDFTSKCIDTLEKGNYAYICNGYIGGNDGDKYDKGTLIKLYLNSFRWGIYILLITGLAVTIGRLVKISYYSTNPTNQTQCPH